MDQTKRELTDTLAVIGSRLSEAANIVGQARQAQVQMENALSQGADIGDAKPESALARGLDQSADLLADTVDRMRALATRLHNSARIHVVNGALPKPE
jgi:ABC-type transporter Mla subunit MlaD